MFFRKKVSKGEGSTGTTDTGAAASAPAPIAAEAARAGGAASQPQQNAAVESSGTNAGMPPDNAASNRPTSTAMLPPEELKRRAEYSRGLMQAFGSIVAVYLRSPGHRDMRLSDIEKIVRPAISTGQFLLAEATRAENGLVTPIAAVAWANVSEAVDRRIASNPSQPMSLTAPEWKSGDIIWIVDAVGDQSTIANMLKTLQGSTWKGKPVKMRAVAEGGDIIVHTLS